MADQELPTGTNQLLAHLSQGALVLTLNRPEARNALTHEMLGALAEQLAAAELNPDVRCVVLTGAGNGFCAGGDVKSMAQRNDQIEAAISIDQAIHLQRVNQRATAGRLYAMPKPTIASISGPAAGAGLSLALACDLRIMSEDAFLTTAFARVGFSGDYGGTFFMTQLVGTAKARELFFLSERIPANRALELGLTNWVASAGELESQTLEMAGRLARGPTVAYRYMKENLARVWSSGDLGDCLDLEATHQIHCGQTEDHRCAVQAFVEKREPEFKGK